MTGNNGRAAPPRTMLLPNETLLDMTGVVSADVVAETSPREPCVVVTTRDDAGEERVGRNPCDTDEQAVEAAAVIRDALRSFFPAVAVTEGGDRRGETGEDDAEGGESG